MEHKPLTKEEKRRSIKRRATSYNYYYARSILDVEVVELLTDLERAEAKVAKLREVVEGYHLLHNADVQDRPDTQLATCPCYLCKRVAAIAGEEESQ